MYQFGDFRLKIILLGQKVLHQCCTYALKIRRYTARPTRKALIIHGFGDANME